MFEKCNPSHPDKLADRIAGALVDMAYKRESDPRIAVEVLLGHGACHIIAETSVCLDVDDVADAVERIAGPGIAVDFHAVPQDPHLAGNQEGVVRCGDNGIFKGMPTTAEQSKLSAIARTCYMNWPTDGKFVIDGNRVIACQSNAKADDVERHIIAYNGIMDVTANPLGDWTGGPDVDSGATNRKLGSDMGDSITGGGLHGKDLSKADVSVNIYAWLKAQETGEAVELCCAIGDEEIDGRPYAEIVEEAREFIKGKGGFEKFAEWGLV